MKALRLFIVLLIVAGCKDEDSRAVPYINEVLDIMEKNSVHRKTIDWGKLRDDAIASTNGGETDVDINRGLRTALTGLNDHHSFITRGGASIFGANGYTCMGSSSGVASITEKIGYIKVPGYSGVDAQFAVNLQNKIKDQDSGDLVGWIVDLRGNAGGNMWPMLAGIGPILGSDIAGYFIDPDENTKSWMYQNGQSILGTTVIISVPTPYTLFKGSPKVAVLIDNLTASSGEAITVAFVERPNTRLFGVNTCGLSTANAGFELSDGGKLQLTVSVMADRNKNKKGGPIVPDETVAGDQEVVDRAVEWINEL